MLGRCMPELFLTLMSGLESLEPPSELSLYFLT